MKRSSIIVALMGAMLLGLGCSQQAEPPAPSVDEAFDVLKEAFSNTEIDEEKARLGEEFLASHPDSEYSGTMASIVAYYLGEQMGQKDRAFEVVNGAYGQITDLDWRFDVSQNLYPLAHELGKPMELTAAADALAATRDLTFSEHTTVVETAMGVEDWQVAESHAGLALGRATAEAYKNDNPETELDDEEIADKVRSREETALLNQGWAMSNLDRLDEAQEKLAAAAALSTTNYLGVAKTEVNTYWGRTMLKAGDADRAIELLSADAVMGDREDAMEALHEAYVAKNGDEEGFDEYLWSTRLKLAKNLDGFTLADYAGESHEVTGGNGKVMLLAFWFPT